MDVLEGLCICIVDGKRGIGRRSGGQTAGEEGREGMGWEG